VSGDMGHGVENLGHVGLRFAANLPIETMGRQLNPIDFLLIFFSFLFPNFYGKVKNKKVKSIAANF
jgi:hypothetical protein